MPKEDVDKKRVRISAPPGPNSTLRKIDDVFIVITQVFCPNGHSLIAENEIFGDHPGIRVYVKSGDKEGEVVLSPFHGDASKRGKTDWEDGEKLEILCPECRQVLPKLASCKCTGEGELVKLYLTKNLSDSHVVGMCNIWGCPRSRTINNWQIISEYFEGQIKE